MMKGYKDTTRTCYSKGGPVKGPKGAAKISKVMGEFKRGNLNSGSPDGPRVTDSSQAKAIALNVARKAKGKK